jgi:hypothetical protein
VMRIGPGGGDLEIEGAMAGQLGQEMVEHPDAGGDLEVTLSVYVELYVDAGLVGFSLYGGDSLGHRSYLLESALRDYLGFRLYWPLAPVELLAGTERHNIAELFRGCLLTHGIVARLLTKGNVMLNSKRSTLSHAQNEKGREWRTKGVIMTVR